MNPRDLCRSLLRVVDSIPSTMPYGATEIDDRHVFLHDKSEEATTLIMEAVAGKHGRIIATECIPTTRDEGGPLLGVLIEVDANADEVAGMLRAAYWTATEPPHTEGEEPF